MKVIIFGATGTVGHHLVDQALKLGHTVTAFSRNPDTLKIKHQNLSLASGDVLDAARVAEAIRGHAAVMCALGAGRKGQVRAVGTANILQAMKQHKVSRLVCQSTLGIGNSVGNLNFFWRYIMFGLLLREAYEDHIAQEAAIEKSDLDWTIIRPGAFTNGPQTGRYKHGFPSNDNSLKLKISRADVADFMLQQLDGSTYLRQTPGLSY